MKLLVMKCFILMLFLNNVLSDIGHENEHLDYDLLMPYFNGRSHKFGHRFVRDCQPARFGNLTHELCQPHHSNVDYERGHVQYRHFTRYLDVNRVIFGHHVVINDPSQTVAVLEPHEIGGCQLHERKTVAETAHDSNCSIVVNAGFFNITDGACLGNVISYGRLAHDGHGIQNAHFGIKKDGSLFFGYLSENEMHENNFHHLVGGVIWLVRNGEVYIDTSKNAECPETQLTGTLQKFIDVLSARLAIGHDNEGRVVIVQIDGKTSQWGMNLYEFAELLISLGVVNAINLDGGGSTTMVVNGTLVNYPSDITTIDGVQYNAARKVSTVLCVRDVSCKPVDCNGHGSCKRGNCHCSGFWNGSSCDQLQCGALNCSSHGLCTEDGCKCLPGYYGENCTTSCEAGHYGLQCNATCSCNMAHSTGCDPVDGHCLCRPGYLGYDCLSECPPGRFGQHCSDICNCPGECFCHHETGNCEVMNQSSWQDGQCMGQLKVVNRYSTVLDEKDYWWWVGGLIVFATVAGLSLILNVILLGHVISTNCQKNSQKSQTYQMMLPSSRHSNVVVDGSTLWDDLTTSSSDTREDFYRKTFQSRSPSSSSSRPANRAESLTAVSAAVNRVENDEMVEMRSFGTTRHDSDSG